MSQESLLGDSFESAEDRSAENLNAPAEWRGMPEFIRANEEKVTLVLSFENEAERDRLIEQLGLVIAKKTRGTFSAWWPPREQEDLAALRFDFGGPVAGPPEE